jgi:hypothetical protein
MNRVEESRLKVQQRLAEIGEAADREVEKARRIKSAAIAVIGMVSALLTVRRLTRSLSSAKAAKKKNAAPARRSPSGKS